MTSKHDQYLNMVEYFRIEWNDFKRAMRGQDKDMFDNLIHYAKKHPQGLKNSSSNPFEAIIIAIILEQEKTIQELWNHVDRNNRK